MDDFAELECEILLEAPWDISQIENMASSYYLVAQTGQAEQAVTDTMLDQANRHTLETIGDKVLLFSGVYAIKNASILHEVTMLGVAKKVVPTAFLDTPMETNRSKQVWLRNGLGLVVDLDHEIIEELELPVQKLRDWSSMWDELILPINQNIIHVANPLLGSPTNPN